MCEHEKIIARFHRIPKEKPGPIQGFNIFGIRGAKATYSTFGNPSGWWINQLLAHFHALRHGFNPPEPGMAFCQAKMLKP